MYIKNLLLNFFHFNTRLKLRLSSDKRNCFTMIGTAMTSPKCCMRKMNKYLHRKDSFISLRPLIRYFIHFSLTCNLSYNIDNFATITCKFVRWNYVDSLFLVENMLFKTWNVEGNRAYLDDRCVMEHHEM